MARDIRRRQYPVTSRERASVVSICRRGLSGVVEPSGRIENLRGVENTRRAFQGRQFPICLSPARKKRSKAAQDQRHQFNNCFRSHLVFPRAYATSLAQSDLWVVPAGEHAYRCPNHERSPTIPDVELSSRSPAARPLTTRNNLEPLRAALRVCCWSEPPAHTCCRRGFDNPSSASNWGFQPLLRDTLRQIGLDSSACADPATSSQV